MCLHGLQRMSSQWYQVQYFLHVLAMHIKLSPALMSASDLSMALGGLRGMGGGRPFPLPARGDGLGGDGLGRDGLGREEQDVMGLGAEMGMGVDMGMGGGVDMGVEMGMEAGVAVVDMGGELVQAAQLAGLGAGRYSRKQRLPPGLLELLHALESKLLRRSSPLTAPMAARALSGLRGLSNDVLVVRRLQQLLAADMQRSTDALRGESDEKDHSLASLPQAELRLDSRGVGMGFFGLQNCTCSHWQTRLMVDALAQATEQAGPLSAQGVGNALYGLQGMSCSHPEVRRALAALAQKIEQMPLPQSRQNQPHNKSESLGVEGGAVGARAGKGRGPPDPYQFSGQNVGNALWGLRNMTTHSAHNAEVLALLVALTPHVRRARSLNGQNIGNALYALHAMDTALPEVQGLLGALAHQVVQYCISPGQLSSLDIGMALYGMRNMDSTLPEVRVILGALLVKIRQSKGQLRTREVSMAIVGVLQTSPWIKEDYLRVLSSKIGASYVA
ncbi:hypothetical protein B484DRAFT_71283 [Ochromonadaceae sp. CCMP2298]|nr:hypothetical protein B484DRAFT_71283 [Ochromonadaceae sp. CCMP2298]